MSIRKPYHLTLAGADKPSPPKPPEYPCRECEFVTSDIEVAWTHADNEIDSLQDRLKALAPRIPDRAHITDDQAQEAARKVRAFRNNGTPIPAQLEAAAKEHHRRRSRLSRQRAEEQRINREVSLGWRARGLPGARQVRQWDLPELGRRSGVDSALLSRVERGKSGLSLECWFRVLSVLGLREEVALLAPMRRTRRPMRKQPPVNATALRKRIARAQELLAEGRSYSQVAAELGLHERTVRRYAKMRDAS